MRAAVLTGLEKVVLEDRPEPEARPGWVVVAVESASLCGTDVHLLHGKLSGVPYHAVPARPRPRLRRPCRVRR